jgi:hypothetical protein
VCQGFCEGVEAQGFIAALTVSVPVPSARRSFSLLLKFGHLQAATRRQLDQMGGRGIQAVGIFGVNVWVGGVLPSCWIVCDVEELVAEVFGVADAMFVIVVLPEWAWVFVSDCE